MKRQKKDFDFKLSLTDLNVTPAIHLCDLWICGVAERYSDGEIEYDIDQVFYSYEDSIGKRHTVNVIDVVKGLVGSLNDHDEIQNATMNHIINNDLFNQVADREAA
jgi:hypothetical protein